MKRSLLILLILVGTITLALVYRSIYREIPQKAFAQTTTLPSDTDWFTLGGNYQRTSWVNSTAENQTEVRGNLNVEWYQPIEPYIPYKVQPIFADNTAFISTSKGLYAFDLGGTYASGSSRVKWVYPTELPLGHSPTVVTVNNILTAYVGGYDKKIHAINANTGQAISGYTPYEAEAGFETNPLVINGIIYVGNRDGKFYALDAITGDKIWEFATGGPILFSAAYKNNALYFASNDNHAYALRADTTNPNGEQIWKSTKLPGGGFYAFWPVIYTEQGDKSNPNDDKDYVIFGGGGSDRRFHYGIKQALAGRFIFPECYVAPDCAWGDLISPVSTASATQNYWTPGTQLLNVSESIDYLEDNSDDRRSSFILDASSGQEYTFNSDGDAKTEYAPFTHSNVTNSGNRYPAIVGSDGILYSTTHYATAPYITRGDIVGWQLGTPFVSQVHGTAIGHAQDEPMSYSSGGNLIYWALQGDAEAGAFDVTIPFDQSNRRWQYFDGGGRRLMNVIPDYQPMFNDGDAVNYYNYGWTVYSGKNQSKNGVYGKHSTNQTPPIPYQGRVYMLKGNTLMSWVPRTVTINRLPLADIVSTQKDSSTPTTTQLQQRLEGEVQKMINAGHLRPGYEPMSIADQYGDRGGYGSYLGYGELWDYFQNPAETVATLIQTLPYLSSTVQDRVKTYIQSNYGPGATYSFTNIVHVGWNSGAARESFNTPSDIQITRFDTFGSRTTPLCTTCGYWTSFPPYSFYAAWKYAEAFGGAQAILADMGGNKLNDLNTPPVDTYLIEHPYILNQYIAGYLGYLKLQELAGVPENAAYRATYNRFLDLRIGLSATDTVKDFSKDNPYWVGYGTSTAGNYWRPLSIARNFMYLTPELGVFLNQNLLTEVQTAVNEYEYVAPYWFVSKFDQTAGEGTLQHLYDYPALFQAKAYILKEPYEELVKYLDVPAFERGDLFYIQNLTAALETSRAGSTDINGDNIVDLNDINFLFSNWNNPHDVRADINGDNLVNGIDFSLLIKDWGKTN